jgi:Na+-transporting NADH:ubiquinone oxidoreductase subunit C
MVLVVGTLLAGVAQGLRGKIDENKRIEKQQNILYAMGVNNNESDTDVTFIPPKEVEKVFNTYIKKQLVCQGDKMTEDNNAYLIDIKKEEALAKKGDYKRRLPLFIGEKDGKTYYIIPVRGKGLWDAIWGYVALDQDYVIQGVYFDHKGETPGLGANIKERFFMDDFKGEKIFKGNEFMGVAVVKGNNDPLNEDKDDNEIDALSGATITSSGVTAMLKKDLRLYLPCLEKITKK